MNWFQSPRMILIVGVVALVGLVAVTVAPNLGGAPTVPDVLFEDLDDGASAALQDELRELQARLEAIEQEAVEEPALQEARADLEKSIEQAFQEADAQFDEKAERLTEIQATLEAGETTEEEGTALIVEAQALHEDLSATQARVMESDPIAAEIDAFQDRLHARMVEVDPEADALIARATEIIEALLQDAGGPSAAM